MSLLEVSHLKKSFNGKPAVDDLSFRVEAGEIFGLLGPNGAGKSTAMMMIAGLSRPDAGEVIFSSDSNGNSHGTATRGNRFVLGLVPQELAIYPDLTGRENLSFFAQIYGMRGARLRERVDHVLDQIGLAENADQYVRAFSGGMKRRLNFGAGLLHEPQLVILDEPTVGVDPQSRSHLLESVERLAAQGVGIIFASHYMEEAESICHRVAIIDHGRLLKCGKPEELLEAARADVHLHIGAPAERVEDSLRGLADVSRLDGHGSQVVVRRGQNEEPAAIEKRLASVLERLSTMGVELRSIETREHNLEQLFLDLTGRNLRE